MITSSTFKNPRKPMKRSQKPMKKGKLRPVSKRPKRQVEVEDDIIWSIAVKKRAGYRCEYCRSSRFALEAHHIISRRYKATRHDMRNGVCLCRHCHESKAHGRPRAEFKKWIKQHLGENEYERLKQDATRGKTWKS